MKTLLIYPPYTSHISDPIKANPPLGLAYIAAVLEKENHEVAILDALALDIDNITQTGEFISAGLSDKNIETFIKRYDPDVVGIYGGVTSNIHNAHNCARITKEVNPDIKVIFGGPHSTICHESVMMDKNVDLIVKGEGEFTFLEIIKRLDAKGSILNIAGTIVRNKEGIHINEDRPYIRYLDSLPFPARHLLPMKIYAKGSKTARDHYMRHPRANVVSSRGCVGDCVFCSVKTIYGRKWRPRSAENVLDELELLTNKYGIREVAFYDDNISLNKKRFMQICEGIKKRKLDMVWDTPNGMAIWTLDKEVVDTMAKSGCYRVMFGIESGCQGTQEYIRKRVDLDFANKIISHCKDAGLWTQSTFIIGFPNEMRVEIDKTLEFIVNSDLDFVRIYIAAPMPGTDMYEDFVREGLIEPGEYASVNYGGVGTNYFSSGELRGIQEDMYSRFIKSRVVKFLNPLRWIKRVNSREKLGYAIKVGRIVVEAKLGGDFTGRLQKNG